ncbi:MAG: hypothetical protein HZA90_18765 [Verrucomicrobia bacterium]|nr:hypothetical protein [Verrucomicrobiota bacterium]
MKKRLLGVMVTVTILGAAGIGLSGRVGAQVADGPEAAAKGAGVQLVSPEAVPRFGTFYLMQGNLPPYPFNPFWAFPDVPIYWFGAGQGARFLVDNSSDYVTVREPALATQDGGSPTMLLLSNPPPPPGGGGGGTNSWTPPVITNCTSISLSPGGTVYLTNLLWGGSNVCLSVGGGSTNSTYDLFGTVALYGNSLADTNITWYFLRQVQTVTTYQLTNQPGPFVAYVLGTPQDTDSDGLTDAFETLVSRTNPNAWDSDGDGLPDGWEWNNGMNPLLDESAPAQSGTIRRYAYDATGRLTTASGSATGGADYDDEGNVTNSTL